MKPDSAFDPRLAAKKLVREGRSGALATLLPGSGDPYCSLVNIATAVDYLRRHPDAEMFAGFGDFAFYRMEISRAHLVAGFGRIVDLGPQDLLADISDAQALIESEPDAIAHMNADRADACRLYATKLLGEPDGDWRCVGIDPEGLELQKGRTTLRLPFPRRVTGPGQLRAILKQLADQARAS
jgi:heme oxygenase (biliverdin-IX-beta and delta-forming)